MFNDFQIKCMVLKNDNTWIYIRLYHLGDSSIIVIEIYYIQTEKGHTFRSYIFQEITHNYFLYYLIILPYTCYY